jgi:RimJ/RimL family protein N-acetyltransferase
MRVTLLDGSCVEIRPIEADDRHALAQGHGQLSTRSQFNRYLAFKPHLSARELDYLTEIDHRDHEALVAIDDHAVVGVARYVWIAPGIAEPAIVIADEWQRRGLAGHLLRALVKRAQAAGIHRFDASALASNHEAISVLTRLGPTTRRDLGDEVELQIDLSRPPPAA